MKRTLLLACTAIMALGAAAQPLLCGHRGCSYGVESSVEALENGAKLGYDYLESDVKVTKDVKFVLSHDDDLKRLGGTKTIASSTLEELQSETLTQTRNGTKYTGRVASLEEMLAICDQYGCKPLIELKWATGINSNDCSNIPALISFLEEKGFRNRCIILTSMKPCLEYIRTNYPDVTLQFLTGQYWANHFDWCVQWRIDVDIQAGYFDKSTVRKYHNEGLLVNMWTTNNESGYKTYGNMGCDFITTDNLDPSTLPELDPEVTFPQNYADYPEIEASVKGKYSLEAASQVDYAPAAGYAISRAVGNGSDWYVLSHDANGNARVEHVGAASGTVEVYPLEGVEGLADITLTADGTLLGCNKTKVSDDNPTGWCLYKLTATGATTMLEVTNASLFGEWTACIAGDHMAVTGRDNDLKVYVTAYSPVEAGAKALYNICGMHLANGVYSKSNYAGAEGLTEERMGSFEMIVPTSSRDNLLIYSPVLQPEEYTFPWEDTKHALAAYSALDAEPAAYVSGNSLALMRYGAKPYLLMPLTVDGKVAPVVYDYSEKLAGIAPVTDVPESKLEATGYSAVSARVIAANIVTVSVINEKGIASWSFDPKENEVAPRDLALVLERQWINSNTTGNVPEHIHGTNAQQGTAYHGHFYVNDCVDKKIYIFDETGCLGSIPGGGGWGCARDDAGNICVRDDKQTGTSHTFIIYPAGAMPDNYGEPTRIEVTVPLDGQTNFINASGDLLGDGGHIYLYSNKQSKVSIISVANGEFKGAKTSGDLRMEATTAGYVIPINDDVENWLYQVRATGLYFYNGGESLDCLTTRASTTAPGRNSTGGGSYLKIGGNKVLLHNCGANYKGGFAVRDLTMDKVYTYIEPIGALGYESGGNYSTFNWIFADQNGEADYTIYQYCPSNGMAVYRLYDPNSNGVKPFANVSEANTLNARVEGGVVTATMPDGSAPAMLLLYNADGRCVARSNGATLRAGHLPHGVYFVSAAGLSAKIRL